MTKQNLVKELSFEFSVRVINLYKHLNSKNEFILSKQILKAGTSIGANIREAENAESKLDFIHKLGIAQKEVGETLYWLELLVRTDFISQKEYTSLKKDADSILKLLRTIILNTKKNLQSKLK